MGKNKFYAVQKGRSTGVYSSWAECQAQVNGYKGAVFKSFDNSSSASNFASSPSTSSYSSSYYGRDNSYKTPYYGNRNYSTPSYGGSYSSSSYDESDRSQSKSSYYEQSSSGSSKTAYYAVAKGKNTGVYSDWNSCKESVNGFPGAQYKKFNTQAEADAFVAQNSQPTNNSNVSTNLGYSNSSNNAYDNPSRTSTSNKNYYGVNYQNGSSQIFDDWNSCKNDISGKRGVTYKKFNTYEEAESFTTKSNNPGLTQSQKEIVVEKYLNNSSYQDYQTQFNQTPQSIYTDGSYLREYNKAGMGVFYGPNDPRNVAEPVKGAGDSYTPEVKALDKALSNIAKDIDSYERNGGTSVFPKYEIFSDSEAACNVLNTYGKTWSNDDFAKRLEGPTLKQMYNNYTKIQDFYEKKSSLFNDHKFKVSWIKGHYGHPGNEAADDLARKGAEKS